MGYVSESSAEPPVTVRTSYKLSGGNAGNRLYSSLSPRTRSQFGFRTRTSFEGRERDEINHLNEHGTWGHQASMLEALDRIQQATSSSGIRRTGTTDTVNDREYTEINRPVALITGYSGPINGQFATLNGAAQITGLSSGVRPSPVSKTTLEGNAGKMMRRYRPTKPDFDLTRFIGELKDTPSLFARGNYIPKSPFDAAGGYLNYQFGITPTLSDIQKGAEAIVKSHEVVTDFVKRSAQRVYRRGQITLYDQTLTGSANSQAGVQSIAVGPFTIRHDFGAPGTAWSGPRLNAYLNVRRVQRMFSTFEYFVGDPYGYTTRMDDYLSKAKKVLGGGLTPSVVYQLTPFSWMLDWFYDIGGLLAYQQDVADNGIVQVRGGYTVEDQYHGSISLSSSIGYAGTGQMTYIERTQSRAPGSPYSMSPTWSMDPYKWAITGALGLLKAKGLQP